MRFWNTRPQVNDMIELRSELIRRPTDPEAKIQELLPTNLAGNITRLAAVLTGVKNLKKLEAQILMPI